MKKQKYYYCIEEFLYVLTEKQNEELKKKFPSYYASGEVLTDMLEWIEENFDYLEVCHVLNY